MKGKFSVGEQLSLIILYILNRKKEEVMTKQFKNDLENVKTDHNKEIEQMMEDFTEAQEILKDKISETQIA